MGEERDPRSGLQRTLPSSYYTSPGTYDREREAIFYREWFCVGREEQLRRPGDYLAHDVAGESILVVRDRGGDLGAFYNVCRHRGSRLCDPAILGEGHKPPEPGNLPGVIRCPYHAWTYGLDGQLLNAPFLGSDGTLRREDLPLYPVGLDTWGGFIFVNLTPASAPSLMEQLGPVPQRLKRYPLGELRTAVRLVYDVAANWKLLVENYNECYHCGPVHPELCEVVPAFRHQGGAGLRWEDGIPHREGAFTFTRTGTTDRKPFPGLDEAERVRHKGELIYPNFMVSLSPEHVAAFVLWPRGPDRTGIACDFLFHPEEMARPSFDPRDAVEFWDMVNRQDWAICERVQRGVQSRAHRFGYYAPMEDYSLDIRRYISEHLGPPAEDEGGQRP